jgi:hypothetical protein
MRKTNGASDIQMKHGMLNRFFWMSCLSKSAGETKHPHISGPTYTEYGNLVNGCEIAAFGCSACSKTQNDSRAYLVRLHQ